MDDLFRIVEKVAYKTGRTTQAALRLVFHANVKFWEGFEHEDVPSDDARPMPGETEGQ